MKLNRLACLAAAPLGLLASCFPKAIVVGQVVPEKKQTAIAARSRGHVRDVMPIASDEVPRERPREQARQGSREGPRLPGNLLDMPGDGDFKSSNGEEPKTGDSGAVISRPPLDPPSRVKPKGP